MCQTCANLGGIKQTIPILTKASLINLLNRIYTYYMPSIVLYSGESMMNKKIVLPSRKQMLYSQIQPISQHLYSPGAKDSFFIFKGLFKKYMQQRLWPAKPKIFIIWFLIEKSSPTHGLLIEGVHNIMTKVR